MSRLLDRIAKRLGYVPKSATKRGYQFAAINRLTNDWSVSQNSADRELRVSYKTMRERSREMELNNDYARRYFRLLENNVLGASGISLQMKIRERILQNGVWTERYDSRANDLIETAWAEWGKAENCTIHKGSGLTWRDVQSLVLRSAARDGAILIRKHRTPPFGLALELLEIDLLDMEYCLPSYGNRNEIRLGVEYSNSGQVLAYHLLSVHPGSLNYGITMPDRVRVPANELLHIYRAERAGQSTGAPWMHSSGQRLKHLDAFSEAAVIAARAGASKMAFLKRTGSEGYTGAGSDGSGNKIMEMTPGSIEELPMGLEVQAFDPTYPNTQFGEFVKSCLRGIAAGLGVSYVSLANDLESVNYSSIRAGLLDEREEWKAVQRWFIDCFITPVFEDWLRVSLESGRIALPPQKFDKFNAPTWMPRRWSWVDPLKDMQASVLAVEKGFTSRRAVISESGGDIEEVNADQAADKTLDETYGLDFSADGKEETPVQDEPEELTEPRK